MIAVDTQILVYAHRRDSPFHEQARETVSGLAEGLATWALPWPCIHDARVAALCMAHGVRELYSVDRDFSRFPAPRTKNPLEAA